MFHFFRFYVFLTLSLFTISVNAEIEPDTLVNDIPDSLQNQYEPMTFLEKGAKYIHTYGSYRINFGMNTNGYFGMSDNGSRFGLEGRLPINRDNTVEAFALIEMGTDLIENDEVIIFNADPGPGSTEFGNAVYSRLGFVGVSTKYFDISIGKQWSVYYDVAEFTDQFMAFGGEANGAFNLDSDGNISGTGRADRVLILRQKNAGPFKVGVQAQFRNLTDNDKKFGDTYAVSLRYLPESGFMVGFAADIVCDGVENPTILQPKEGDQSFIAAIGYVNERINVSYSYSRFFNHELIELNDSTNYYYSGHGMELFLSYRFAKSERWRAAAGFNYLLPDKSAEVGDYRMLYYLLELSYYYGKGSEIFTSFKIIDNIDRVGSRDYAWGVFGTGLRLSFGY